MVRGDARSLRSMYTSAVLGTGPSRRVQGLRAAEGHASQLVASLVDGLHHEVGLIGLERGFEPHHPARQIAQEDHPLGVDAVPGKLSGPLSLLAHELTAQPAIPAADPFQLSPGRKGGHKAAISTRRSSVSGVATRVMARTLAYEIRPAASAASRTGNCPSARATRTFSRAVAGSSPILQVNQYAQLCAP
jgi:hypothetical protein